ncbi:MAG: tetratricopeptide repeat protein [bacterium]
MTGNIAVLFTRSLVLVLILTLRTLSVELDMEFLIEDGRIKTSSNEEQRLNRAYQYNLKGIALLEKNKYKKALQAFNTALEIMPAFYSDPRNNIAVVYYRQNKINKAREIWQGIIKDDTTYFQAYFNLALLAYKQKNFNKAIVLYERGLEFSPANSIPYQNLGALYFLTGEYNKALVQFREAVSLNPEVPDNYAFLAESYIKLGNKAQAIRELKKSTKLKEKSPVVFNVYAWLFFNDQDYTEARKYYHKALKVEPEHENSLLNLGIVNILLGNFKEAVPPLKRYAEKNPEDSEGALQLSIALEALNRNKEALHYLKKGIKTNPSDPVLRYNLGALYYKNHEYRKALDQWQGLNKESTGIMDFELNTARLYMNLGDIEQAETIIKNELSGNISPQAYLLLAKIKLRRNQREEAVNYSRKALKLDPSNTSALLILNMSEKHSENIKKSMRELKTMSSGMDPVLYKLAISRLYYQDGRLKDAISSLSSVASPKSPTALSVLAYYYGEAGDSANQVKTLNILLPVAEKKHEVLHRLGLVAFRHKDYIKAQNYFARAMIQYSTPSIAYELAHTLYNRKLYKEAVTLLDSTLIKNPSYTPAKALLAYIFKMTKDDNKARSLWKEAVKEDGANAQLHINLGLDAFERGEFDKALSYYENAVALAPDMHKIHLNIGNVYRKQNRLDAAKEEYKKALAKDGTLIGAYQNMALVYMQQDSLAEADTILLAGLKKQPEHPDLLTTQGHFYLRHNKPEKALKSFLSIPDFKNSASALRGLGLAYIMVNNSDKAKKYLFNAFAIDSTSPDIRIAMGNYHFLIEDYSKAIEFYIEAAKQVPGDLSLIFNRAKCHMSLKEFDKALDLLDLYLEKCACKEREVLLNKAIILGRLDKLESSLLLLTGIIKKYPCWTPALIHTSITLHMKGKHEQADSIYQKAVLLDPNLEKEYSSLKQYTSEYRNFLKEQTEEKLKHDELKKAAQFSNLGIEFLEKGDTAAALEKFTESMRLKPDFAPPYNNLGLILQNRGDSKAIEMFKKAAELDENFLEAYFNIIAFYINQGKAGKAEKWFNMASKKWPDNENLKELLDYIKQLDE